MGNQKQKWTAAEEETLLAGVAKHGAGKWKNIINDPEFQSFLSQRSNIDLKDKWRNLRATATGASKEKPRPPKQKALAVAKRKDVAVAKPKDLAVAKKKDLALAKPKDVAVAVQRLTFENTALAASVRPNPSPVAVVDNVSKCTPEEKAKRYNAMIFEALATMKDMNGSDIGAILDFIKVQNGYKIKKDAIETPTPTPKQKGVRSRKVQKSGSITSTDTVQDAADNAAYKLAEAENRFLLAAEALKEADRISKMAEDTDAMLQLIKEIYEQCSRGELLALA